MMGWMKSLPPSLHGLLLLAAGSFLVALAPRLALAEGAGASPGDPEHRARPAVAQAVERAPGRALVAGAMPLPEPIEPQALARSLADQPQNYLLLDVRPPPAFAEYHVPGAQSVTPEQALEQAQAADAAVRLVILDRDGT